MWVARHENLTAGRRYLIGIGSADRPMSFAEAVAAWRADAAFRAWFNRLVADAPYSAFRWECPGATAATAGRDFEFVLLDAPVIARAPDAGAFAGHFETARDGVVDFANLSGDARLVVPRPLTNDSAYGHLAAFVRHAPAEQIDALWETVGDATGRRLGVRPVWLSTAGAGVAWLHVRLDDRPKYYGHAPYRRPPA